MTTKFDAIVVGTGMGGATTGYALARAGLRVLFLEKGFSRLANDKMIQGAFAETGFTVHQSKQDILRLSGRKAEPIVDKSGLFSNSFVPFIGEGGGGSSAIYGAILERFRVEDFTTENAQWPVSYNDMLPYYDAAENLYGVSQTVAGKKENLSQANQKLWKQLESNGLHPYCLPTAASPTKGKDEKCIDNCQSYLCAKGCKNDSEKSCLKPSIEQYGATLWDNCEVLKLEEKNGRIENIVCRHNNKIETVSADIIILAAGALSTPCLLFQSKNSNYPTGLANSSGLVGRYLMRHYIDLFAIDVQGISVQGESQKQIGFNDFYQIADGKFGTVQSFGLMPPIEVVIEELSDSVPVGGFVIGAFLKIMKPVVSRVYDTQIANKLVLASIMEDSPDYQNRVALENNTISLYYKIPDEDWGKIKQFRKMVLRSFEPLKVNLMKQADNNKRIAHACGTCRFGEDPKTSVLNPFNRSHDIANLYVTDASFFPSSSGINPSLTIAANALRVANHIISERH